MKRVLEEEDDVSREKKIPKIEKVKRKREDDEEDTYSKRFKRELDEVVNTSSDFDNVLDLFYDRVILKTLEKDYIENWFLKNFTRNVYELNLPQRAMRETMPPMEVLKELIRMEQGGETWKANRGKATGASEACVRIGLGHYNSSKLLLLRVSKVIILLTPDSIFFFIGHCTEPTVRDLNVLFFREVCQVKDCDIEEMGIIVNPHDPTEQASPDGSIQGGPLKVPKIFRKFHELCNGIEANTFMAELKSTVNRNPMAGETEFDYVVQLCRQIYIARFTDKELFPLGYMKDRGILAMLRLPYDRNSAFNGPELYRVSVNPNEEVIIRFFLVAPTREFNAWFKERSAIFLDHYNRKDWNLPNLKHSDPHPMPFNEPIVTFGLGKFSQRVDVTFPGYEEHKNRCILSGPGKNEPLAQWIFGHNLLLTGDFHDCYLRTPGDIIMDRGDTPIDPRSGLPINIPPQGMRVLEIDDTPGNDDPPNYIRTSFHLCNLEMTQYASKAPYSSDALLRNNRFFDDLTSVNALVIINQKLGDHKTKAEDAIYASWIFTLEDFGGVPEVSKWGVKEKLTRTGYMKRGKVHPNLKTLIDRRRKGILENNNPLGKGNIPYCSENFYLILTKPQKTLKSELGRFQNTEFITLSLYDGEHLSLEEIKKEEEILEYPTLFWIRPDKEQ